MSTPFRPSASLLRRIAKLLSGTPDRRVSDWIVKLNHAPRPEPRTREFRSVSLVKTYRGGRLCGYEVWRHLESSLDDPSRTKARLWFGRRRHGGQRALNLARAAARVIEGMGRCELREWWTEYKVARAHGRKVDNLWRDERRFEDRVDFNDLRQMSHAFDASGDNGYT